MRVQWGILIISKYAYCFTQLRSSLESLDMMRVLLLLMAFLTLAITSIMDETENKLGDSLVGITEIGEGESEDKEAEHLLSALSAI